jgi:putative SOS response-associated peptidase YedK
MPVILTTREEIDCWMTAPTEKAIKLQRPLPDDALMIVAKGRGRPRGLMNRPATAKNRLFEDA